MRRILSTSLVSALFLLLLLLFQISVLPAFSLTQTTLDLLFVLALSLSLLFRYSWGLTLALVGGILFDLITLAPGRESVGLLLALLATNALFLRFFTNKSLWTLLLLGGVGTIILRVTSALIRFSFTDFFSVLVLQIIVHSFCFILLFTLFHLLGNRLKPYILVRQYGQ